jgi:hypothetical protein
MTRSTFIAATLLALGTVACGPMDADEEAALLDAQDPALVAKDVGGGDASGLTVSATVVTAGSTLLVTVGNRAGARVYVTYPKAVFAGPGWVKIPSGRSSATVTLHVSPFLTAPTSATISARTSSPDAASFFSQVVTVTPSAAPPATRPQVASAILTPSAVPSGATSTLEVTLTAPAPDAGAAVLVAITNDFLGQDAEVAPVLLVPAGATRASATIRTHLANGVTSAAENVVANLFGGTFQGGALLVTAP